MNTEPRIAAAVVIYNRECADSAACCSLLHTGDIGFYLMDNSTQPNGNAAWCAQQGWRYIAMGGNQGLPKAYNAALEQAQSLFDALALFDDDTAVPAEYFDRLRERLSASPAQVFVPIVRDEAGLLSPCAIHGHRVRRATRSDVWQEDFTAINSGLALRLPVHGGLRYDEGYFLDYADHAFVQALKAVGAAFEVLPVELRQRFSNNQRGDTAAALRRYRVFRTDFTRFCADTGAGRTYGQLYLWKRALTLALRHHNAAFIKAAFE